MDKIILPQASPLPDSTNIITCSLFLVIYSVGLIVNLYGIVKFFGKQDKLHTAIMATNAIALIWRIFLFAELIYMVKKKEETWIQNQQHKFYYMFFQIPFHLFNLVAFLMLLHWIQAWQLLKIKSTAEINWFNKLFASPKSFTKIAISLTCVWLTANAFYGWAYFRQYTYGINDKVFITAEVILIFLCFSVSFGFPLVLANVYALLETYLSPTALQKNKMKVSNSLIDNFRSYCILLCFQFLW